MYMQIHQIPWVYYGALACATYGVRGSKQGNFFLLLETGWNVQTKKLDFEDLM